MVAGEPGEDPAEDPRLTRLDDELRQVRADEAARTASRRSVEADPSYRLGNRVLAELLGGLFGGGLIGWLVDRLAGTFPAFFLGLMFLGIVVAFRNIIRISNQRPK